MSAMSIAVDSPVLDLLDRVRKTREPVQVETLVAKPAVEALDEAVLHRLAGLDEVELHSVLERPLIERSTCELRAVVDHDRSRQAALGREPIEHSSHSRAGNRP